MLMWQQWGLRAVKPVQARTHAASQRFDTGWVWCRKHWCLMLPVDSRAHFITFIGVNGCHPAKGLSLSWAIMVPWSTAVQLLIRQSDFQARMNMSRTPFILLFLKHCIIGYSGYAAVSCDGWCVLIHSCVKAGWSVNRNKHCLVTCLALYE
jgi:hypothetical protein